MERFNEVSRRSFLRSIAAVGLALPRSIQAASVPAGGSAFKISLAQWSLHRSLRDGSLKAIDFPATAASRFGIRAVEYVNSFYREVVADAAYLSDLKSRCADAGVRSMLVMIDGEGALGDPDAEVRQNVVENHYKWIEWAAELGCHSVRVNAAGSGDRNELASAVAESLHHLCAFSEPMGLNVLVENHGGFSSDAAWLCGVMERVSLPNCGTLPDFGNFCIRRGTDSEGKRICIEEYDRYRGIEELMPYARAVSAKSYAFDDAGEETTIDYGRVLSIVLAAGYDGHVGIEYEGTAHSEDVGIRLTRDLLLRLGGSL